MQNVICFAKRIFLRKLTNIESFSQFSAQNQTTEGLFKYLHTQNYDHATLNMLLLITKTLN